MAPSSNLAPAPGTILELRTLAAAEGLTSSAFSVIETLSGGMGICVHVIHGVSGREYGLKTINAAGLQSEVSYQRFLEEARIWITLSSHGGVVPAFCIERVNEVPVVCAQWMRGGALRGHLASASPPFFFATMDRIARTLHWAWTTHAVIHRDLKPENILLNEDRWPYVGDWGLGRMGEGRTPADPRKAAPTNLRYRPGTWVTVWTDHMGDSSERWRDAMANGELFRVQTQAGRGVGSFGHCHRRGRAGVRHLEGQGLQMALTLRRGWRQRARG